MSTSPQEIANQAETQRSGARIAKAKLQQNRNLMQKAQTRQWLRKAQLERGGMEDGEHYRLQANSAGSGSAGEVMKADGHIRTIFDMVDYYYGFLPQAMGGGGSPMEKADAPVTTGTTGVANTVYGSEVYSNINSESNVYSLLEKRPWQKSGERYVKGRNRTLGEGGESENASLPDTNHPDWDTFEQTPRNVVHTFDVSQVEQLLAQTQDDHLADDPFDWLRTWYGTGTEYQTGQGEHPKHINAQLLADVDTAHNGQDFQSLDRAISNQTEESNILDAGDADIYGFDRSSGEFESNVLENGGTNRSFVIDQMDEAVKDVREASGKDPVDDPNYFWLTGHDTYKRIEDEVGGKERLEAVRTTTGMNGVNTVPGDDVGITVRAYKDIPIFRSNDVTKDGISRIYLVDSSTMWIKQLLPTQFYSSGIDKTNDPFAIDRLGNEGMFLTIGELTMTTPVAHAKIRDLK